MTDKEYSIQGLRDLLNDLENLSNCLMTIPLDQVSPTTVGLLNEDQYQLIKKISDYSSKVLYQS